jgi:hypothetical protein
MWAFGAVVVVTYPWKLKSKIGNKNLIGHNQGLRGRTSAFGRPLMDRRGLLRQGVL